MDILLDDINDLPTSSIVLVDFKEGCLMFHAADGRIFRHYVKMSFYVSE